MKHLITLLCLFTAMASNAQTTDTIPKTDNGYELVAVKEIPSITKDRLYKNSKMFFVDNFKSANNVIQYDDKEEGKIVGKGFAEMSEMQWVKPWVWDVYYSTEIIAKDGKYRYRIYDILIKEYQGTNRVLTELTLDEAKRRLKKAGYKNTYPKLLAKLNEHFFSTVGVIEKYMSKNVSSKDEF